MRRKTPPKLPDSTPGASDRAAALEEPALAPELERGAGFCSRSAANPRRTHRRQRFPSPASATRAGDCCRRRRSIAAAGRRAAAQRRDEWGSDETWAADSRNRGLAARGPGFRRARGRVQRSLCRRTGREKDRSRAGHMEQLLSMWLRALPAQPVAASGMADSNRARRTDPIASDNSSPWPASWHWRAALLAMTSSLYRNRNGPPAIFSQPAKSAKSIQPMIHRIKGGGGSRWSQKARA